MQEVRVNPVWLPYGYAIQSQTVFELPEGYDVDALPSDGQTISGAGMLFKHQWRRGPQPDEITWIGQLTVGRRQIWPDEYPEARSFARRLRYALQGGVVLHGTGEGP
jgi:hypothetical protein